MAAPMENVRVRLSFTNFPNSGNLLPTKCWFLVRTSHISTIKDLQLEIVRKFSLERDIDVRLWLEDCLLPSWESSRVLRENDLVVVEQPGGKNTATALIFSEKSSLPTDHPASPSTQLAVSPAEVQDDLADQDGSSPIRSKKGRKKKKKRRHKDEDVQEEGHEIANDDEHDNEEISSELKLGKKKKHKKESSKDSDSAVAQDNQQHDAEHLHKDKAKRTREDDDTHVTEQPSYGSIKKPKTESACSPTKAVQNVPDESPMDTELDESGSLKPKRKRRRRRKKTHDSKEVVTPIPVTVPKTPTVVKMRTKMRSAASGLHVHFDCEPEMDIETENSTTTAGTTSGIIVEENSPTVVCEIQVPLKNDTAAVISDNCGLSLEQDDSVVKPWQHNRPPRTHQAEAAEATFPVQERDYSAVPPPTLAPYAVNGHAGGKTPSPLTTKTIAVTLQSHKKNAKNSPFAGVTVFKRQKFKKQPSYSLSKEEQLNTMLTNRSVIFQNTETQPDESVDNNIESNTAPEKEAEETAPAVDLSQCAALHGPPRTGDTIAFKILELSEDYTPGLSAYKIGKVLSYNAATQMLDIELDKAVKNEQNPGKFDLTVEDDNEVLTNCSTDTKMQLHWPSLVEPKLVTT